MLLAIVLAIVVVVGLAAVIGAIVMVVAFARSSDSVGILHGGMYTPIPWTPHTATAAW